MDTPLQLDETPVLNVRRETLNGREFLVGDVTFLKEGVLNGSKGALYYPFDEIEKRPGVWNGVILTANHPMNGDRPDSARKPQMMAKYNIGYVFNDYIDERTKSRRGEVWVDVELANKVDKRLVPSIINGSKINVSTGLFTVDEKVTNEATYNGKVYTHIARNYQPDHLAILLDNQGACSINDGCGINVNAKNEFHKPENYDKIRDVGEGKELWAGANDWESGWTWAGIHNQSTKNKELDEPIAWININHKSCPGCKGELNAYSRIKVKQCQEYGKDKVEQWLKSQITSNSGVIMRKELVSWLTTNCECYKGKDAVLNDDKNYTDDELKKLKTNAEQATLAINALSDIGTTLNAKELTVAELKSLITDNAKRCADMDDDEETPNPKATMNADQVKEIVANHLKGLSEKERIDLVASPKINSMIKHYEDELADQKRKAIVALTANFADEKERNAKALKLKGKSLEQLKELLEYSQVNANVDAKTEDERFLADLFKTGTNNQQTRPKTNSKDVLMPTLGMNIHADEEIETIEE